MPTIFTHALVTGVLGKSAHWSQSLRSTALCAFCGLIPDLDGIGFHLGIPYEHVWGHRGLTHSFSFAFVLGIILGLIFGESKRIRSRIVWGLLLSVLIASHPILDMLTNGGHGVAIFAPFDHARHFFPNHYRVIQVSPMSLSPGLKMALISEFYWVWIPTLCYLFTVVLRKRSGREEPPR